VANGGQYTIERWTLTSRTLTVTVKVIATGAQQTVTMTWTGDAFSNRLGEFTYP
jgi:hypothetical protein